MLRLLNPDTAAMIRPLIVLPLLLAAGSLFAGAVPQWLLEVCRRTVPPQPAGASAVVLLDEVVETIQPNARCLTRHRYAVRLLNRAGYESARGSVDYLQGGGSVQAAEAWLLRAGKEIRPPKRRDWVDVNDAAAGAVFDERRSRVVSYRDLVIDGDVFGYETVDERGMLFAQSGYEWDNRQPVLVERFALNLPAGWTCDARLAGPQAGLVVKPPEGTYTWTMLDRPYLADEPALPPRPWLAARLMLTLHPPAGVAKPIVFNSWGEVADWDLSNSAGQCDTDPALAATVRELTEGCPDTLGRIRALCRHVQQLRYVAVNKGLAEGMGYRPRKATEVHAKGWGDCKDKANLLSAMLREAGIASYGVNACIGAGRMLDDAWLTPAQFNHAITAIKVDDSVVLPAVVEVPGAGRMLFFDQTEPDVLVGDLPLPLQGTKVQVLFPGNPALTTLPLLPSETSHRFETRAHLALASGGVAGECTIGGPARAGALLRAMARCKSDKEQRALIAEQLNGAIRGARIDELKSSDDLATGDRRMKFTFAAPRFGQAMAGGLLLVRLDVLGRSEVPAFPSKDRTLPVRINPIFQQDEVVLDLPDGVTVDEMPEPTELSSDYGRYSSRFEKEGKTVVARRSLRLDDRIVPDAEYAALRKFLGDVAKADHAPVVLRSE
jgi:hypothetical protein